MIGALTFLLVANGVAAQSYRFPIEMPASGGDPYITAYRDHDGGGGLQDYACGNNTYNGHKGTDIGIGGFAQMDAGSRVVVAAADGVVATAVDGCFDRCTSGECNCGDGFGNYVRIDHADGKRTYYGHLMQGSVTVAPGDVVVCGQALGRVGSSGFSTGPHLHFEPRDDNNVSDDPYAGDCGGPETFWIAQGAYNALPGDVCEGGTQPPPPPPPVNGTLRGVVFEDVGVGTADMTIRLAGASVAVNGTSLTTTASADGAHWIFDGNAPPGALTIHASAPGYVDAERTCDVAAAAETWCSIGLVRAPADDEQPAEGEGEGDGDGDAPDEPTDDPGDPPPDDTPPEEPPTSPDDDDGIGDDIAPANAPLPPSTAGEGCASTSPAPFATFALLLLAWRRRW